MKGTSGNIRKGSYVSIRGLLYGMMLNSGNECALGIAIAMGAIYKGEAEYRTKD